MFCVSSVAVHQVFADFETYGEAVGLSSYCVYGGTSYGPQENALRKGVDIVVGTPGRIKVLCKQWVLQEVPFASGS